MKNNHKKIIQFILKLLVSGGLLLWLIMKISWKDVWVYLQNISLVQIILYVAVLLLGMVISSYKWRLLAKFKGFEVTLAECFRLYLTGTFINNFFPSFIGGDTYRAYQLGKPEKRFSPAAASVVMDRLTGLIGAMALAVFFALANWHVVSNHQVLLLVVGIVALCLVGVASLGLIMKLPFWKHIIGFVPKKVLEFLTALHEYYAHRKMFAKAMLLSMLFGLVGLGILNYVIFWALGIHVGVLNYLSVIFLISIVSSVPISINNIGVQEWAYVTFFGFFGVSSAAVIAVSIVIRILQMIVSFTALPMYLKRK
jgi:uncharacterized protein (TIRG00374 family)